MADFFAALKYIAVENYNHKPHVALFGLTPIEALNGAVPDRDRFANEIALARRRRIEENRKRGLTQYARMLRLSYTQHDKKERHSL
jgi:hypothetical protein